MGPLQTSSEYRLLVQQSPVTIWRSGLKAECDYFNETWLAFIGRTMKQEVGNGWAEGVHPGDFDRCVAHSLTETSTCEVTRSSRTWTLPPFPVNFTALERRFHRICCNRSVDAIHELG
jgi:hypothetical protein